MIFSRVPPEAYSSQTNFFILSLSSNQRRFTFIEPPESIARNLAVDMNPYFPYQVASDRQPEKGLLMLDIRDKTPGSTFVCTSEDNSGADQSDSSEVGPTYLSSLALALHRKEGVGAGRFYPYAQEAFQLPDWCEEGSLGLPS